MGFDTEDAISVNIKADLNLWHTALGWQDTVEHEASQCPVIGCHRSFPLQDVNLYARLIVRGGTENLALGGGDSGITGDEGGSHRTEGLDTEGEGGNIKQQDFLDFPF